MQEPVFILLSLGANIGDRYANITKAVDLLSSSGIIAGIKSSSIYETEPVGFTNQPWFLNSVVSGYTSLSPDIIIGVIKNIQELIGRKQREKWHEREIDIDVLLYGNEIIKTDLITIPHPRMHERRFVLVPASEIAGDIVHPEFKKSIKQLLIECKDESVVKKYL